MKEIRIFDLHYDDKFIDEYKLGVERILRKGFLTNDEFVEEFEKEFSNFIDVENTVAVSNGTDALQSSLQAINVENKAVLLPTNTFIATEVAIKRSGGKPFLLDIEKDYFGLCPKELKAKIKELGAKNIGAVIAVHIGGHISDRFMEVVSICESQNIPLIEDCAHAHGATLNNKVAGSFGRFGCFSFFTTKTICSGEGGMVTCQNENDRNLIRSIRQFGKSDDNPLEHVREGGNYKLSEFNALLGKMDLSRSKDRIEKRRFLAKKYQSELDPKKYYCVQDSSLSKGTYYKQIVIPLNNIDKSDVKKVLSKNRISLTGEVYRFPVHTHKEYKDSLDLNMFPNANEFSSKHFCPPCYPELTEEDIIRICKILNEL